MFCITYITIVIYVTYSLKDCLSSDETQKNITNVRVVSHGTERSKV